MVSSFLTFLVRIQFKAAACLAQQIGRGSQIPVGVLGLRMTQIDGQVRQKLIDIHALAVPVEQTPHGKSVAEASEVGTKGTGWSMDAQAADNAQEGSAHCAVGQRGAGLGDEESLRKAVRSEEHTSELQSLRHLVCRLLL